jgi:hypothetical protein
VLMRPEGAVTGPFRAFRGARSSVTLVFISSSMKAAGLARYVRTMK